MNMTAQAMSGGITEMPSSRCWQAVTERQTSADRDFVYAVRTTKIYCRPSCPSKRPHADHVLFFNTPHAAELAGFRPCRRCHPEQRPQSSGEVLLVWRICQKIDETLQADSNSPLTLSELSHSFGLSAYKIERLFHKFLRITPRQFTDVRRMLRLKSRLRKGEELISAMYSAGYGSSSRLYERAPSAMGMTPAVYQRGGKGMKIRYTIVPCALGRLLVAATNRGISAVYLGNSERYLKSALLREYPQAEIHADTRELKPLVKEIIHLLRGREPHADLPLDIRATAFQRRVWEELRRIPLGCTRTYGEIARGIGQERAFRAVARACATNPVSVVVPCHRVIRADGDLTGYRWGLSRKKALLALEKKMAAERASSAHARARKA